MSLPARSTGLDGVLQTSMPSSSSIVEHTSDKDGISERGMGCVVDSAGAQGECTDEVVYLCTQTVSTSSVPVLVEEQRVAFDDLPALAKANPTHKISWAQRSLNHVVIETYMPPTCPTCLRALEERALAASQSAHSGLDSLSSSDDERDTVMRKEVSSKGWGSVGSKSTAATLPPEEEDGSLQVGIAF